MNLPLLPAALLAVALLPGLARGEASVEGVVTLPPSRAAPVMNQRYEIISEGGTLSTSPPLAVVYLEGAFPRPADPPTRQVAQKDFSYSPSKRFDLGRYRADERPIPAEVFDVPGLVVLRCDIHEHMRGLILVLDTPHFVVTEPSGRYRLGGLPAGHYTLKVWLTSRTTLERPVDLPDGATLHVDFP